MSAQPLPHLHDADFGAQFAPDGTALRVSMSGTADLNVQKKLKALLTELHAAALTQNVTHVFVDWRALEFMNSSCLKEMVSWLLAVRREPPERQYKIVFLANPGTQWQPRSLQALACMATKLVSIQE